MLVCAVPSLDSIMVVCPFLFVRSPLGWEPDVLLAHCEQDRTRGKETAEHAGGSCIASSCLSGKQTPTPAAYAAAFSPGRSTFWQLFLECSAPAQSRGSSVGWYSGAAR